MALAAAVYSLSSRAAPNLASNMAESLPSCANQYRSLPGIVLSCITTIFLCIWVALHLNVPEPVDTKSLGYLARFKISIKCFFRCTLVPVFVTLVVPEWVLGMAVRQFIAASRVAKSIGATRQQGFFIIMGGFHLFKRREGPLKNIIEIIEEYIEETHPLVENLAMEVRDGRGSCAPGKSQKMNNPFEEEFGEPVHPLDEFDVCHLLQTGKLRLPNTADLEDRCKSDGLAKFLIVIQTFWFISQCIARKLSKLPLTELEIITLGYTLLTVAMYIAWWDKPYRVRFPVRVYETLPKRTKEQQWLKNNMEATNSWETAFNYAAGTQAELVDLRSVKQVPIFYSGFTLDEWNVSDLGGIPTTVIVGTLFGAVHFLGWSSPFPSTRMQFLWRFAAIAMTAVPPAALVGAFFGGLIRDTLSELVGTLVFLPLFLLPPLYFVGRGVTVVLALVTLAKLPLDAYRDVEWSDFFPHI
ncbi:SubName: Full=Uncharacterized protein {ECO:0000313/EMBL:CCA71385.1} [Serendipita indica DSM 11827]|nr:SubName: Full=Uncharacterized protein {ECO:0000313/EMBL:CCA71385.1} [Serendipita indica DSM 11827]